MAIKEIINMPKNPIDSWGLSKSHSHNQIFQSNRNSIGTQSPGSHSIVVLSPLKACRKNMKKPSSLLQNTFKLGRKVILNGCHVLLFSQQLWLKHVETQKSGRPLAFFEVLRLNDPFYISHNLYNPSQIKQHSPGHSSKNIHLLNNGSLIKQ